MSALHGPAGGRPLLRGLALVNDMAVLRSRFGPELVEALEARLTPAQRETLRAGLVPSRWYEEDIQVRLCGLLADRFDPPTLVGLGAAIARHNVNTAQRFLARVAGPRRLLRRTAAIWSYWRDTGRLEVAAYAEGEARVVLHEHAGMTAPGYALLFAGASGHLVSLTGARDVRVRATVTPEPRVTFEVRWGDPAPPGPGFHPVEAALARLDRETAPSGGPARRG